MTDERTRPTGEGLPPVTQVGWDVHMTWDAVTVKGPYRATLSPDGFDELNHWRAVLMPYLIDVLVGTYMGEDDRITLRTICGLARELDEPASELRKMLARTSEVRRPPELDFYGGAVTEFLSRSNPADLVQEIAKLKVVPTYGNILQDVDGIMKDLEVGKRGSTIKLMTALSLVAPREREATRVTRWMSQTLKEATTPRDKISFWAGSAVLHQLEDLWSLDLTIDYLADHPITPSSPAYHEPHLDHPPDHQLL